MTAQARWSTVRPARASPWQIQRELGADTIAHISVERPGRHLRARYVNVFTEVDEREAAMLVQAGARDDRPGRSRAT